MTPQAQVVWITGAGTGIGRAVAGAFAAGGARVALMGRRRELLEGVAEEVRAAGGEAAPEPLDVAERAAVERTAERLLERWGRVDILVNNAGTNIARRRLGELDPADWDRVLAVNLTGAYNLVRAVLAPMRAQGGGLIVNVSSVAGTGIHPLAGVAYTASKQGMMGLSHMINEDESRHGIRACAICPGEVATPILEQRPVRPAEEDIARMIQPEDIAQAVTFVASVPPRTTITEITVMPTVRRTIRPEET